jgi:protein SCO1/2
MAMKQGITTRGTVSRWTAMAGRVLLGGFLIFSASALLLPGKALAQVSSYGDKTEGENVGDQLPDVLKKVQVTQHLNGQLPMNASFVDDKGATVKLGSYFDGKHPAIVTAVYYNCPMLCSEEMDGLTGALEMVHLVPGKDFQIVVISIDPSEGPALAAKKKAFYLKRYGHPETADGWHFLTGQKPAIDAVTNAIGFGYLRVSGPDGRMDQFAHASSIEIATPTGKLAQYYLGVEYSPKDVLLGLVDASGNKIGSPVANILTYCYRYDPQNNKHSLIVARVVQLGGIVTVAWLGGFIFLMFRRDIQLARGLDGRRNDDLDIPQPDDKNRRNG